MKNFERYGLAQQDWSETMTALIESLKKKKLTASEKDIESYLCCCAEAYQTASLPVTFQKYVEQMFRDHGMLSAQ